MEVEVVEVVSVEEVALADDSGAVKERLLSWMRTMVMSSSMALEVCVFQVIEHHKGGLQTSPRKGNSRCKRDSFLLLILD